MAGLCWSAASQRAMREAALAVLVEHVGRNAQAVIATQQGPADEEIAAMVAAGWTLSDQVDHVAGKRIRYLTPPPTAQERPL